MDQYFQGGTSLTAELNPEVFTAMTTYQGEAIRTGG
jgi:hypothetical protein